MSLNQFQKRNRLLSKWSIILLSSFIIMVLVGSPKINSMYRLGEAAFIDFSWSDYALRMVNSFLIAFIFLTLNMTRKNFRIGILEIDFSSRTVRFILNVVLLFFISVLLTSAFHRQYDFMLPIQGIGFRMFIGNIFLVISTVMIAEIYHMMIKNHNITLSNEKLMKKNAEAKFEVLKNQVNPHFLFNSFYTINGLIEKSPEMAKAFVLNMSDVYRYVLQNSDKNTVKVNDELYFLDAYISMLKDRFGDSIDVKTNISPQSKNKFLPPLAMHTLLENAVKHNTFDQDHPLTISISANGTNEMVVKNNLCERKVAENSSEIGLYNLNLRYKYLSNEEIIIQKTQDEFIVTLPLLEHEYPNS